MDYQYDLADFKRYLNQKNEKYRVDGLIFWQNRIPLPIDLFNRIFNESDQIVTDYIYQVAASAVTFSNRNSFQEIFDIEVTDLPKADLKKQLIDLNHWLTEALYDGSAVVNMTYEIADLLGMDGFTFSISKVADALQHQGKKYARIFMPVEVKQQYSSIKGCDEVGQDNTDMFGNIIADKYNIYRSGFSDALAIIFNALLEFRILFSGKGGYLPKVRIIAPVVDDVDVRIGKTSDGSLWEPRYEDDHYITINQDHPLVRQLSAEQFGPLAECLFFLGELENSQFSDEKKKFVEELRQSLSRSLWIKYD